MNQVVLLLGLIIYAYIFIQTSLAQSYLTQTLSPNHDSDHFGQSVAINNEFAVVGAPEDDTAGGNAGMVHIYQYDNYMQQWNLTQQLTASDASSSREFGYDVAIFTNYIFITTPWHTDKVYICKLNETINNNTWYELQILQTPTNDYQSVDITDGYAIVGSRYNGDKGT